MWFLPVMIWAHIDSDVLVQCVEFCCSAASSTHWESCRVQAETIKAEDRQSLNIQAQDERVTENGGFIANHNQLLMRVFSFRWTQFLVGLALVLQKPKVRSVILSILRNVKTNCWRKDKPSRDVHSAFRCWK